MKNSFTTLNFRGIGVALALLSSGYAFGQGVVINSLSAGSMLSGPNMGQPSLDIRVSGASAPTSGVHPYTFNCQLSADDGSTNVSRTIQAFIAFQRGRDELIQIPFSTITPQRFSSRIKVTGNLSFGGSSSFTETNYIPLPIVLVPGIDFLRTKPDGGDGTWTDLEGYLRSLDKYHYHLRSDDDPDNPVPGALVRYPTLSTLIYNRNVDGFTAAASKLKTEIDLVKATTYADKVLVIAHSKGTLVCRQYFANYGSSSIRAALLVQGPHTGSVLSKFTMLGNYFPVGGNYENLYPTYPSVESVTAKNNISYTYSPKNIELDALNNNLSSMPTDIPIWLGVTRSYNTHFIHRVNSLTGPSGNKVHGDLVVPEFSQIGQTIDPATKMTVDVPAFENWNLNGPLINQNRHVAQSHITSMESAQFAEFVVQPFLIETLRSH